LKRNGTGLNVLIGSSDTRTGVECVEALANRCGYKIRCIPLNRIIFSAGLVRDLLTQLEMSMVEYVFKPHIGHRAMTVITGCGGLF